MSSTDQMLSGQASNTSGYSVPSETNVATGRRHFNSSLRSIVMSRTAFSLFHGFNPTCSGHFSICDAIVPSSRTMDDEEDDNNDKLDFHKGASEAEKDVLLQSCKFETMEVPITTEMGRLLREECDSKIEDETITTFAEAELQISTNKKKAPRLDVTWGDKVGGKLAAFVEVGLVPKKTAQDSIDEKIDQLFWKKTDQAINYLELLAKHGAVGKDEAGEEYRLECDSEITLLLSVIVLKRDCSSGRMAVFACEPKADGSWRMALMWRKEAPLAILSHGFGAFAAAIKHMARNQFTLDTEDEAWKYLGPNCSKVDVNGKSVVLRSYDNRVRQTSRSPFLYHNWNKINGDTKVVLTWNEGNCSIEFRDETYSQQSTLFRSDGMCGKLEVIAVPFIPGNHISSTAEETLHIVRFLKDLHDNGYVHGDIRALNCVFAGEDSALIDFDFGGTENDKYPPGYAQALPDGMRLIGGATTLSTKLDVRAIRHVVSSLHTMEGSNAAIIKFALIARASTLHELETALEELVPMNGIMEPREDFAEFMTKFTDTMKQSTKKTLSGSPVTPERETTLPSKRALDGS